MSAPLRSPPLAATVNCALAEPILATTPNLIGPSRTKPTKSALSDTDPDVLTDRLAEGQKQAKPSNPHSRARRPRVRH